MSDCCKNCENFNYERGYLDAKRRHNQVIESIKLILQPLKNVNMDSNKCVIGDILKDNFYDYTNKEQTEALCNSFDLYEIINQIKRAIDIS